MQQPDSPFPYYPHHHNHYPQSQPPPPTDHHLYHQPPPPPPPSSYASAPPSDYPSYSQNYPPPFPVNSDPVPPLSSPTAPHYPSPQPPLTDPHGLYSSTPSTHLSTPTPPPPVSYYSPYDSHYTPPPPPPNSTSTPYPNPSPNYVYDKSYDNIPKFDYGSGYFDENLSGYGGFGPETGRSNYGSDLYGKRVENDRFDSGGLYNNNTSNYKDDGVFAYQGKSEPYGARGTGSKSSTWSGLFDDYGRAISFPSSQEKKSSSLSSSLSSSSSLKVVKAVPKAESNNDVKSGVQKFRVKFLPESGGQSVMDVLCMVGLDGIRMLDPSTSRTLRIYPLETVTRCDKIDSSTFAFWSKTSVDIEPRRIRLQSNSYTTNTILDTVTAATVQFKEMGGRIKPPEPFRAPEQAAEKKKGLTDWINKLKPVNEEKDHWVPDEAVSKCTGCGADFSAFNRRHHCRNCGDVFCDKCTQGRTPLTADDNAQPVRVCDRCMAEVTHRLSKTKEVSSRPVTLQSHEDLAKKLQEEMERNLRISSGSKSEGSGRRMREVACPTCTVHLQVQVPSSGSETIECGVCQHPFLVSAQ